MGTLYFLLIVGLFAAGLVWLTRKPGREGRTNVKPPGDIPRYHNSTGHHSLRHNHAHNYPVENGDIWKSHRREATKEQWGSYTITANKIRSDGEVEQEQESSEVAMTAIEYVPEESKPRMTSTTKR